MIFSSVQRSSAEAIKAHSGRDDRQKYVFHFLAVEHRVPNSRQMPQKEQRGVDFVIEQFEREQ